MAVYKFHCQKCDVDFEAVQSMGERGRKTIEQIRNEPKRNAKCSTCGVTSVELIFSSNVSFIGTSVQNAEFNPAFGQVVKNKKHRNDLAKEKGLIEIGNESTNNIHKNAEESRARERKRRWDDA